MTSVALGLEKLKGKEVQRVQDDCIAVALELPQLKILWQQELEGHIEVTVIYRRGEVTKNPSFDTPISQCYDDGTGILYERGDSICPPKHT